MKKITSINIGGHVLALEEGALAALQAFLTNLRHIHDDKINRDEIIQEAEQKIAERMHVLIQSGSPFISESDMDNILAEFRVLYSSTWKAPIEEDKPPSEKKENRLYRNADDVMLGGVCSGIAHRFNIDPSIIRVLFAVFAFSGWVALGYLVLWIVIPSRPLGSFEGQRIYRDINNKILGGVASGIAHYFNWDVVIVRLAFLAPIILSIVFGVFTWPFFFFWNSLSNFLFQGSMTGTFFLAYVLLWAILPPMGDKSIAHSLGSLARVLLYLVAGIAIFMTFSALIAAIVVGTTKWPLESLTWANEWQRLYAYGTLFLFFGIPLLGMLVWTIRRMAGWNSYEVYLRAAFALLWGLGCVSLLLFVSSLFRACPSIS